MGLSRAYKILNFKRPLMATPHMMFLVYINIITDIMQHEFAERFQLKKKNA